VEDVHGLEPERKAPAVHAAQDRVPDEVEARAEDEDHLREEGDPLLQEVSHLLGLGRGSAEELAGIELGFR
jgi:hypothetical protein